MTWLAGMICLHSQKKPAKLHADVMLNTEGLEEKQRKGRCVSRFLFSVFGKQQSYSRFTVPNHATAQYPFNKLLSTTDASSLSKSEVGFQTKPLVRDNRNY